VVAFEWREKDGIIQGVGSRRLLLGWRLVCLFPSASVCVGGEGPDAVIRGRSDAQFTDLAPYGSAAEITRHFGYKVPLPDYELKQEKFRLIVPEEYSTNAPWGLLVWISPGDDAYVPDGWERELTRHRLLFVSAYKSGNERHPLDRFRLALDATCNVCRKYAIDRQRIYAGGFSGGGRIASMLGVAYGDILTGTLPICGVNFYRALRSPEGEDYPAAYTPDPGAWARAKQVGRFALVTGEKDPSRPNTKCIAQSGFKRDGFKNVLYFEVPGMGHAIPDAAVLKTALDFLDGKPNPG
jgi:predicted esterase